MTIRLLTIPISHYCEKARWGLERLGLAYQEEAHIQGFHYWRTWRLSGQPLVPVLIDNGETITGSSSILRHLERYARPQEKLYPDPPSLQARVGELESRFDDVLGVESRRWFYFQYRREPVGTILKLIAQGVPAHERLMARWLMRPMQSFAGMRLKVTRQRVEAGLQQVREILASTDALLADGRRYLLGERFTAADLSFACLMAPFTLPRRYGAWLPGLDEAPLAMQASAREISQTLSGRYAIRLFEEERPTPVRSPQARGGREGLDRAAGTSSPYSRRPSAPAE